MVYKNRYNNWYLYHEMKEINLSGIIFLQLTGSKLRIDWLECQNY